MYTLGVNNKAYKKGYREGYNNPSQFDEQQLLKSNSNLAKGVIAGICQKRKDEQSNAVSFEK